MHERGNAYYVYESQANRTVEQGCVDARQRIHGVSEMAGLIRAYDWSRTSVGSIDGWSNELFMAVNMLLSSKDITTLFWGPDQVMIYNDLYGVHIGTKHPRVLGQTLSEAWAEIYDLIKPLFVGSYKTGEAVLAEQVPMQVLYNGELVERIYTMSINPVRGPVAGGIGVLGLYQTAIDHTTGVQAARQLKQVMETTTDSILAIDRAWKITYMNHNAARTTAAAGTVMGKDFWACFPHAIYEGSPYVEHYYRAMEKGVSASFEAHYPEPLDVWVEVNVRPSDDGIILFFRDITLQKQSAKALLQNEKLAAVGRLSATIAHEINNPLESVTNLLYLARISEGVTEQTRKYLESAEIELRRASAITSQTLRFHKQATKPIHVNFAELIDPVLAIQHSRILNSHVCVEKRERYHPPILCFDGEIRQVLANLIGNAIDGMQAAGGRLLLRSRKSIDWTTGKSILAITVADTGPGIPREVMRKIFEAFFTTKGLAGTGLGLWICKDILERHRGRVALRSSQDPKHRGTVFIVYLPFEAATRE